MRNATCINGDINFKVLCYSQSRGYNINWGRGAGVYRVYQKRATVNIHEWETLNIHEYSLL